MLDQNPESRPTACALSTDINCLAAYIPVLFCDSCCRQDEGSSDGFGSDEELWVDGREHGDTNSKSNTPKPRQIPIYQSNLVNHMIPRSLVPLRIEAADVDGSAINVIMEAEDIHSLGVVNSEQGRLAEAEAMCKRALVGREKGGRRHWARTTHRPSAQSTT
ncbi:hypothetical protein FGG08_005153 [Glutinoglossum americanum]|uniref:Uncharacterized protein n=1 Tax=Glutinoglossum americanum TaxID=1670608 RepID=A0A9P8I0V3_9PEZI|nr:hypothetical protein FGG08_005153 [Glutinoglossum americanum]